VTEKFYVASTWQSEHKLSPFLLRLTVLCSLFYMGLFCKAFNNRGFVFSAQTLKILHHLKSHA